MESSIKHTYKDKAMSFLDAFEDVFTEPENVLTIDPSTAAKDIRTDYFDREDEPVIW